MTNSILYPHLLEEQEGQVEEVTMAYQAWQEVMHPQTYEHTIRNEACEEPH